MKLENQVLKLQKRKESNMAATPKPVRKARKEIMSFNKKVIKEKNPKGVSKISLKEHNKIVKKHLKAK